VPEDDDYGKILRGGAESQGFDSELDPAATERIVGLFRTDGLLGHRAVGPAIALDMIRYMRRRGGSGEAFAEAVVLYLLPQLEGLDGVRTREVRTLIVSTLEGWAPDGVRSWLSARFDELFPELETIGT
jgi:hypothetical protein